MERMHDHIRFAAADRRCPYLYVPGKAGANTRSGGPEEDRVSFSELMSDGQDLVLGDLKLLIRALRLTAEACEALGDYLIYEDMLSFRADDIMFSADGRHACLCPAVDIGAAESYHTKIGAAGSDHADTGEAYADGAHIRELYLDASYDEAGSGRKDRDNAFSCGISALLEEIERRFPSAHAEVVRERLESASDIRGIISRQTLLRELSLMEYELAQ